MLRLATTIEDIIDLKAWFEDNQRRTISLDVETTGLDVYSSGFQVRTIQFGTENEAWVIPFQEWKGAMQQLVHAHKPEFLIHNSQYEHEALLANGFDIPWTSIDDTMIAMRLAEPHHPAGLKVAASRLVSRKADDAQKDLKDAMKKHKWTWATVPIDFPPFIHYAAMDVILTTRLANTAVCKSGFDSPVYSMEMDYRALCCIMERNGMRFDIGRCLDARDKFTEEISDLTSNIAEKYGISVTSNGALGKWLIENKAPMTKVTAGGAISVDEDALKSTRSRLEDDQKAALEVIDTTLRIRKLVRLSKTYLANILNNHNNGNIHPQINTIQARTGRSSITGDIPLQTLPRADVDDPDASVIRESVIARNPGELIVSSDYDQMELRAIGSLSHDKGLQEAFRLADETGEDFFTQTTRMTFDDPSIIKNDPRRNLVKTLSYSSAYGAGIHKMATSAGVSDAEMKEVSDKVFSRFPGIKSLMKRCENSARNNDWWITTPYGRRLWVNPEAPYVAMNCLVQGFCGDIFKDSMIKLAHAGLAEHMIIPVHDEILMSLPEDIIEDVRPLIGETMTIREMAIPITAAPSKGCENWAQAK